MSKENSETTEYMKQSGACAAVAAASGSQHAEIEFPAPAENPMPATHYVATGTYKAPAPDASAAAPKKGGAGYLAVKRAFDIVFSAGVCVVLAIPVAAACVAIVADTPGKPFFRQERIGQGGKKNLHLQAAHNGLRCSRTPREIHDSRAACPMGARAEGR